MKIVVLMSSYNGETYISEQIDSILNQAGEFELELMVRDDGSTDGTTGILEEYAKSRGILWYKGDNVGPQESFYSLLQKCNEADYYAFADQDDVWNEDKLERGINKLKETEKIPSVYFSNAEIVNKDLIYTNQNVYAACPALDLNTLSVAGGILGCTIIFNQKTMQLIRMTKEVPKMLMHDFYVALLCKACEGSVIYDEHCNMKYRQHGGNVVGVNSKESYFSRFKKDISQKYVYSIADQADFIIENYKLNEKTFNWLKEISNYRRSFWSRLGLAVSSKTRYGSLKSSIKNRLTLLMGNR